MSARMLRFAAAVMCRLLLLCGKTPLASYLQYCPRVVVTSVFDYYL